MTNYVIITPEEYEEIKNAGYNSPSIFIENGVCYCEELLFDMYESKMLNLCESLI